MMGRAGAGNWSMGSTPAPNATIVYKIGIYGWRKRCLYVFILLMMVTIIINLALTIWILKVMDFHMHGMGHLRMADDGVKVEGDTEFLQGLYASSIRSNQNEALLVESARNISLNARDKEQRITNRLVLGDDKITSYARMFEVRDRDGELLFAADRDRVQLGASSINVAGSGGATFWGSVQSPIIKARSASLRLESPTRSLELSAPEGVTVRAEQGPVQISSSNADINIESYNQVTLEAKTVRLKSVAVSEPSEVDSPFQEVYQLCICAGDGKLFLSPPRGNCQATGNICD